jgi:hypothetical protein
MHKLLIPYRFINLLSIDVALGAVCSALFFARLLSVQILPVGLITLGLSVWIIYSVDHLLDARKLNSRASTKRHRFHQEHSRGITIAVLIATIINAVLVFFIRKPVFMGGIVLMLLVGVYLVLHRWIAFPKEILIALLYAGGVFLPSVSVTTIEWINWPWSIMTQFVLTALLNLIIFSWFDQDNDRRDGSNSFVLTVGSKPSRWVIWILFSANVITSLVNLPALPAIIMLMMNLVLMMLFLNQRSFSRDDIYRLAGDAVFFIPVVDLLINP